MSLTTLFMKQVAQNMDDSEVSITRQTLKEMEVELLDVIKRAHQNGEISNMLVEYVEKVIDLNSTVHPQSLIQAAKHDLFEKAQKTEDLPFIERFEAKQRNQDRAKVIIEDLKHPEVVEFINKSNGIRERWNRSIGMVEMDQEIKKLHEAARGEIKPHLAKGFR